ncbi:MAG: DUF4430 domain-containing protein [Firmicutes bacterium]|nr:DUF4430 domain-containing protein [Bacillota bacterium]
MKKLIITIVILIVAIGSFFYFSQNKKQDIEGEITIIIMDEIGDTITNANYSFSSEDTLFSIINSNYDIGCANTSYQLSDSCDAVIFGSRVILQIEDIMTDWQNSYISIYENNEYATAGIDSIALNDGDVFRFEYTSLGGGN